MYEKKFKYTHILHTMIPPDSSMNDPYSYSLSCGFTFLQKYSGSHVIPLRPLQSYHHPYEDSTTILQAANILMKTLHLSFTLF